MRHPDPGQNLQAISGMARTRVRFAYSGYNG
jgi:hypothetical protein